MTFGDAIEHARLGQLIQRSGWNGKGMFVFIRPGWEPKVEEMLRENLTSLPTAVKQWFANNKFLMATDTVQFTPYFCMKAADGSIVNGWLASQTDMLATDWSVLEQ